MLATDLSRIADVEFFRIIQFFVTQLRGGGAQAAQSLQEASTLAQLLLKCVGWMQFIKKLGRIAVGSVIDDRNGLPRGVSHRKHSVSFHQE